MRMLGIESSCDDTAAAVVEDGHRLLSSSVISSQLLHRRFGGVVPEVAAREHTMAMWPVVQEALERAHMELHEVDALAVTEGPGLLGALMVGVTFAKALADALNRPLVGVHHVEAHLYANALVEPIQLPALAMVVSGGHTSIFHWTDHGHLTRLGQTRDDAAGEAFDKGARLLGLPYPGGPEIEAMADGVATTDLVLPIARLDSDAFDFSFSGVKTATRDMVSRYPNRGPEIAWALQEAVVGALLRNLNLAWQRYPVSHVYLAGGVTANRRLSEALRAWATAQDVVMHIPPRQYCTDNAAMVAALGYVRWKLGERMPLDASPRTPYPLGDPV